MEAADFWQDPDTANKVVAELKGFKAQIDPFDAVARNVDDAKVLWEMAEEADDAESRLEVDNQIDRLTAEVDRLETMALLSGKYDTRN